MALAGDRVLPLRVKITWATGAETWEEDCTTVCPPGVACQAWVIFRRDGHRYIAPNIIHEVETFFSPEEEGRSSLYNEQRKKEAG